MATLDLDALRSELKSSVKAALGEARQRHGEGEICGYALYSDSDAATVSCSVNTNARLAKQVAEDPDDADYYRWSPNEWSDEGVGSPHFRGARRMLAQAAKDAVGKKEFIQHRTRVFEVCVGVLEDLIDEGFLESGNEKAVIVFAASDYEDAKSEKLWVKRLNVPAQSKQFVRWINSL